MKRLNPRTGKAFEKGDVREDGYIFRTYTADLRKDGFFYEHWSKPNIQTGKKRNNPDTGKPFKYGDIREDGKLFRGYKKEVKQNGFFVEIWAKKLRLDKGVGLKRINPVTGVNFKAGDVREDGYIFVAYKGELKANGYNAEQWMKPKKPIGKKRLNIIENRPYERGDLAEDGKIFLKYSKSETDGDGYYIEYWKQRDTTFDGITKRNNPQTGQPFEVGFVNVNGAIFDGYILDKIKKPNFYAEKWILTEKLIPTVPINPKTNKPWQRGDVREEDGYIFKSVNRKSTKQGKRTYDKEGYLYPVFAKPAKGKAKKRRNPETGKKFKLGDQNPENPDLRFVGYTGVINKQGFSGERWKHYDDSFWLENGTGRLYSLPELRIYSELKAFFDEVELRFRSEGEEIDIFIPQISVGVEYDGSYWHKGNEEYDQKKTERFSERGVKIIRVREKPLNKIFDTDIIAPFTTLDKSTMDKILDAVCPDKAVVNKYKLNEEFVSEDLYRKLVTNLPSPPYEKSLAATHPKVASQWHPTLNQPLKPKDVTKSSNLEIYWLCENGHTWKQLVYVKTRKHSKPCIICANSASRKITDRNRLSNVNPELAKWFDEDLNGGLAAYDVAGGSQTKYWWRCTKSTEHIFQKAPFEFKNIKREKWCALCVDERNKAILHGYISGQEIEELAKIHVLTATGVRSILANFSEYKEIQAEKGKVPERVIKDFFAGRTVKNLQKKYGLSKSRVYQILNTSRRYQELKLIEEDKDSENTQRIRRLFAEGKSAKSIMEDLGVSESYYYARLALFQDLVEARKNQEISSRKNIISKIKELRNKGMSNQKIGDQLNLGRGTIRYYLKRYIE